mmetsp:Transcript_20709/g.33492  ORF Transcript_20709/g.33492 Transcript_20709/m.33492 type:complete len:1030 (-) Transcript_20709:231-3320(-)
MSSDDLSNIAPLNVPMESSIPDDMEVSSGTEGPEVLPPLDLAKQSGMACNDSSKVAIASPTDSSVEINNENADVVEATMSASGTLSQPMSAFSSTGTGSKKLSVNAGGTSRHVKLSILTDSAPKNSVCSLTTPVSVSSKPPKSVSFLNETPKEGDADRFRLSAQDSNQQHSVRVSGRVSVRASAYPGRPHTPDNNQHSTSRLNLAEHVRQSIQCSKFYHTDTSHKVRLFLHGKFFMTIMTVALFVALFFPDLWVVCGFNDNIAPNIILTIVLVLFLFELLALSLLDVTYLLSFFFFMDTIGTISMIFDISFLVGIDHTKSILIEGGENEAPTNLMLLRAARAARLGARAGRLSRIIKILRFLPFLGGTSGDDMSKGYAGHMSRQLSNLLGTRVACLTIILVIAIPVIDILSFPQLDHAMQTWVERLDADRLENSHLGNIAYGKEVLAMVDFFDKKAYGPYIACPGYKSGDDFVLHKSACSVANFQFDAPNRGASAVWVHTDTFMVGFNMHQPNQVDHGLAMLTTAFIIVIMIFSALALSSVVTRLAVRPLESMLKTVRQIAETVFNFSKEMIEDAEDEGEDFEIDTSLEMKLLEKVVTKLAAVAQLQNGTPQVEEDMATEDIAILNMMEGRDVTHDGRSQSKQAVKHGDVGMSVVRSLPTLNISDIGVTPEVYNSFAFNTLVMQPDQMISLGVYVIACFHEGGNGFINTEDDLTKLKAFVTEAEKKYLQNKFHNFCHASDVLHGVSKMMRLMASEGFLVELDQFALLVAAIGHDLAHLGVNNGFLLEVQHELALQYNDLSPLENMHVSELYGIVAKPETNVFHTLTKEQYNQVRKTCIEAILHTDMMSHFAMVKDLEMLFQVNAELFVQGKMSECHEVLNKAENKLLVINNILHSADVSNPCRKWEVSQAWAHCVLDEFFAQGDEEKKRGIPVQMLNDRDKINRPNSQIGFLEFVIAPFFCAQIRLFHRLFGYGDNLSVNIEKWEELWVKETNPDEEGRIKVRTKVENVKTSLFHAKEASVAQGATAAK